MSGLLLVRILLTPIIPFCVVVVRRVVAAGVIFDVEVVDELVFI